MGSNPVEALIFFRLLLSNCLNWKIYCDDHTSLSESVMSKIDEIDNLNIIKLKYLNTEVDRIKVSLTPTKSTVEAIDSKMEDSFKKLQESNRELKNKLEHLKRYSRDFNIILIGVEEEQIEDCMAIVSDHSTLLGFEEAHGELENAHRTGSQTQVYYCKIAQ